MIQLKNITKNYAAGDTVVQALKDVSINFRDNEFVSILGQSGCGKTTLLNVLGGLDKYDNGEIIINGKSTKEFKDKDWDTYRNHYIGFIFQSYNLIPHLTVLENVEIALSIAGLNKKERREKAINALARVGLNDQLNKKPNQLSGGQMQRVAIARAIVNNPKIILADEPTGALDSETSVQIMNLLQEIAGDHLIIMVTHNQDIANDYSNRIVSLLDGVVIGDTNPYEPTSQEITEQQEVLKEQESKVKTKAKTSMSFWTAIRLSFKNLLTKKGRTFMTSFAGSIGIIGIALILAVSNGFTNYINGLQKDTLGNYPVTISTISVDLEKFKQYTPENNTNSEINAVIPYDMIQQYIKFGHYNNLSANFVEYVENFVETSGVKDSLSAVNYNYYTPVKFITKNTRGEYKFVKRNNNTSIMTGGSSSSIYPMLENSEFAMEGYEFVYGRYPQKQAGDPYTKEMLLVIGEGNKIDTDILDDLGIAVTPSPVEYFKSIAYKTICSQEYKLLFNDDYYIPNSLVYEDITAFEKLNTVNQEDLKNKYDSVAHTLKISGIVRPKKDAIATPLPTGLVYMQDLEQYYSQNCKNSLIAKKQHEIADQKLFYDNYYLSISEMGSLMGGVLPADGFSSVAQINEVLTKYFGYTLDEDHAYQLGIQQIGISEMPIEIKLFPKNFEAKDQIINMISEFNKLQTDYAFNIIYSDTAGFLTESLGQLVDIISYVLIGFSAISLIVSSIMIAIITYVSVIERTKEIGVLRSIGARKKDISRVFNAETLIIGLLSGLIGVFVSWMFSLIISAVVFGVSSGTVANIAVLAPTSAIVLIAISVTLTLIAGFIPSKIAAKKDPVKALRTE